MPLQTSSEATLAADAEQRVACAHAAVSPRVPPQNSPQLEYSGLESSAALECQERSGSGHMQITSYADTYAEIKMLRYWEAQRPVARIFMATVADRRGCRALRASWALHGMEKCQQYSLGSCRGCGNYPSHHKCEGCDIAWCGDCYIWSRLCWKCYRPQHDGGESLQSRGGLGGNGSFE
jgi:hypothetical protein